MNSKKQFKTSYILGMFFVLQLLLILLPVFAIASSTPKIAAGGEHTVAIKNDGTVVAWGHNASGQLGIGTYDEYRLSPTPVPGLTGVVAVAAGAYHTVALKNDGTVVTWGSNGYGQLGDGTTNSKSSPTDVPGLTGITAIAAGFYHTVALKNDGTVIAWGFNDQGELGDGTTTRQYSPKVIPNLSGIIAIDAGVLHTVALKSNGTVVTWGNNDHGQLGDGTTTQRLSPVSVPGLFGVTDVAAGYTHTVALKNDGRLEAWGGNSYGQLGDGTNTDKLLPEPVHNLIGTVSAISVSMSHTVALLGDGTVATWGSNINGELGDGITDNGRTLPDTVQGLSGVEAIAAGYSHTVVIKYNGSIEAWGSNSAAQIGDGIATATPRLRPVVVPDLIAAVHPSPPSGTYVSQSANGPLIISWGNTADYRFSHVHIYRSTTPGILGTLVADNLTETQYTDTNVDSETQYYYTVCSVNIYGNISTNTRQYSATTVLMPPADIVVQPPTVIGRLSITWTKPTNSKFSHVQIFRSTIQGMPGILVADNQVGTQYTDTGLSSLTTYYYTVRSVNIYNSVSTNTLQYSATSLNTAPVVVPNAIITKIAVGSSHTVALKSNGGVVTWGANYYGQLGDGSTTDRITPAIVPGLSEIIDIAAGSNHSVALKNDGTVAVWGANSGQIPTIVPGLTGVIAIAAGNEHTVVLKDDGSVVTWGQNFSGQLGDGTTDARLEPATVPGLTGVIAITAGDYHTVVLKDNGSVVVWGDNTSGQLGDGTFEAKIIPISVPELYGVTSIAAGNGHTVARLNNGTVAVWGANNSGQLGNGTFTDITSPTVVPDLSGVNRIAAGSSHTVALKEDGTVLTWGANYNGQLGNGSLGSQLIPSAVPDLTGVAKIFAGYSQTFAIRNDGSVIAWGYNSYSQLGDSGTLDQRSPVAVSGLTADILEATPPAAPSTVYAYSSAPDPAITISWVNPTDADFSHVHIYRSTIAGNLGSLVYDNVSSSSLFDNGLTVGNTYFYTVRSVDNNGNESTNSNQVSAIVSITPAPSVNPIDFYRFVTVAGGGDGDGGPAALASVWPYKMTLDDSKNLYFIQNSRIRKIDAITGIVTTVAGGGEADFYGDNGPATSASISPTDVAVDRTGNIYIADLVDGRIRKVDVSTGNITIVAGKGTFLEFSGDGGPAISAGISPLNIAVDSSSNIYFTDFAGHRIRKIDATTANITTVAGNGIIGFGGDNGPATNASITLSNKIAVDSFNNIYLTGSERVRMVSASTGYITTVAGNGTKGFAGDGGLATSASLNTPDNVAVDRSNNIFFIDKGNNRVRMIEASTGNITTVAGNGIKGFSGDNGQATAAAINPSEIALDKDGNLFMADGNGIRKVAKTGFITSEAGIGVSTFETVAGTYITDNFLGDNLAATSANLVPAKFAFDAAGNIYIAEKDRNRIRKVDSLTGIISTVAGDGFIEVISRYDENRGDYNVIVGRYSGDNGYATSASLNNPSGVAVDGAGNLYIADTGNNRIRKVESGTGIITTVAGDGYLDPAAVQLRLGRFSGDGGPATSASLSQPSGVAFDRDGNLYIADTGNGRIRKVSAVGIITTEAGSSSEACNGTFTGDTGPAVLACLWPDSITIDTAGNFYIAESTKKRIRKVTASTGVITTVAGSATQAYGYGGDVGPATSAVLNNPVDVAVDGFGNLYIADDGGLRMVTATTGIITTIPGGKYGVAFDGSGILHISDSNRLLKMIPVAPTSNQSLSVATSGTGTVFISSTPAGISCGYNCTAKFAYEQPVTLNISGVGGSPVVNWTGCDSSTPTTCTVSMNSTKNVTATFSIIAGSTAPVVFTDGATSESATYVTINGRVDNTGGINSAATSFQYGLTSSYGSYVVGTPAFVSTGAGSTPVSATLTGLTCNTTYHYRIVGENSAGTTNGGDNTFLTPPCNPVSATLSYAPAGPYKAGDRVAITADFNATLADTPAVQLAISSLTGGSALTATTMTKISETRYIYFHTIGEGNGVATVTLSRGVDLAGNPVAAVPVTGGSFTVEKTPVSITLQGLVAIYDGSAKAVIAYTIPAGLTVDITYDGSPAPPVNVGSYAVVATINSNTYQGSINRTLLIAVPAPPDSFNPQADSMITSLAVQGDGSVLVGGNFSMLAGQARNYIARLNTDGSLASFNPGAGTSPAIDSMALQDDGKIVVGGSFTTLAGQERNHIGRFNADGTLDTAFNPGADFDSGATNFISSIVVQADGKILIGGNPEIYSSLPGCRKLCRLNPDGSLDTTFITPFNVPGSTSNVRSVAVQSDGKMLVGGDPDIGLVRLNPDGSLDTTFSVTGGVTSIGLQADGKILVGGVFTALGGEVRSNIGRFNADGSLDTSFNPGVDGMIFSLTEQTDGKILASGLFSYLGGQPRSFIGRLNPDGTVDSSLNPIVDLPVGIVALQADGKILLGGAFTSIGGQMRSHIGRISNTDPAVQQLNIATDGGSITWNRSGSSPEVWRVTFEDSGDGQNWTYLGNATRITGGWQLTGLTTLHTGQNRYIRARGFAVNGGISGSSGSIYETVQPYYLESLIQKPAITFVSASPATTTVTLNAIVTANGATTDVSFEYGTTISYGSTTGATPSQLAPDASGSSVSASISGLVCGAEYHYHVVGVNSAGTTYGSDYTFTTAPCAVNGICGISNGKTYPVAPSTGFCQSGQFAAGSNSWNWSCSGVYGGTDAPCSATQLVFTSNEATAMTVGTTSGFFVTTNYGSPLPMFSYSGVLPNGVVLTDNGNGTATISGTPAPGTAGSYPVTISATNSGGAVNQIFILTVSKAAAAVSLTNLTQAWDGTAKAVDVSTTPNGLSYTITYNGSATLPTVIGSYTVAVTITDSNYQGTASGTLIINDQTRPVISTFTALPRTNYLIADTTITATDNVAVTGYCLTEALDSTGCTWIVSAQATYTFATAGTKTLYAYVKDAAGNISQSYGAFLTVTSPILTVSVAGSGTGTVTSSPAGISCTTINCTGSLAGTVTLYATPSILSKFGGWGGGICSGTAATCSVTMVGDKTVTATFNLSPALQIGTTSYATLQEAYNAAVSNDVIQMLQTPTTALGTLTADRPITVKLKGGYDSNYTETPSRTSVSAPVIIKLGTVIADGIEVK